MKCLLVLSLTLMLFGCATREKAISESMNKMTAFKGELYKQGKKWGTYEELNGLEGQVGAPDISPAAQKMANSLKALGVWKNPELTELPKLAPSVNPLLNATLDNMKRNPVTEFENTILVKNGDGKLKFKIYLLSTPVDTVRDTSGNEQVRNEKWLVIHDLSKKSATVEMIRTRDNGSLKGYWFDDCWPTILEKNI